jgi:hypothetical protein
MATWEQELQTPITADIGLSERDRQGIYNLARKQVQGGWGAAAETLKGQLAGRGFRVGETGFADVPLAQMYSQGVEQLGNVGRDIALEERKRRFEENQALASLNLQRSLGAGGIAAQREATGAAAGTSANQLAWDKEKYAQQLAWDKESQALSQLLGLYGGMMGEEEDVYAPYYDVAKQGYNQSAYMSQGG